MFDWLGALAENGLYAPHGYCLLWKPELIWTHVISDGLIALAYFSIPVALIAFIRKRQDLEFGFIFWLFALFIMACGTTHLMSIWNLWNSDYGYEAGIKAVTAVASVLTAWMVWPLLPRALAIPSPSALKEANDELTSSLLARDTALEQLREEMAERRRAEEQLVQTQKIEALGQLTGGIAHDFNNLLQAISSSVQLIERAPEDPDRVLRWSAMAREATAKAERLTAQLLTFSRVRATAIEPVELDPMLEGMQDLLERSLGPSIDLDIRSESGAVISIDRTQIELALLNLVINARDALPEGGEIRVTSDIVEVTEGPELSAGHYATVSVADNGTGIPPDILRRVFDPFFSTKEAGRGTGLGLSMVHSLLKQHGGTIEIDSEPGRGTVATMLLPLSEDEARPAASVATPDVAPDLKGLRVLVVDDDQAVRAGLVEALRMLEAEVEFAADGERGLVRLKEDEFDVLLSDYAMPGMNGAELARLAKELQPALRVVMATGFADFAEIEEKVGDRMDVLRKPFSLAALAAVLGSDRTTH
ncbi:hypothetical protein B5C34_02930 [Pacificimonas flava]|uniref:histidine kinase n=3 Tax=Sphingosinicellaceae TaxID=2820280 RepID=A0A219B3X0_9SPHN|nr:response regulator [Pacificimonas aurantium]OWV32509.1 hypothetical protein B5C34_02930 [Pacificimonas flava]